MTIKKTLLAIAISSAVAAPAALAQSSVQIYGKLYPYLLSEKGWSELFLKGQKVQKETD